MKSRCVSAFMAGAALLILGCGGGKKVTLLEQQVAMLGQRADTLEGQLAKVKTERDALSLDKTLQKAELDIVRRDLKKLRAANDSLQALVAPPKPMMEPRPVAVEADSARVNAAPSSPPVAVVQSPTPPPPDDLPVVSPAMNFQRGYDQALALFKEKKYPESARSFGALLESDRNHRLSGNCQYWIGECLYARGKYGDALAEFQKVFVYPNNFKADAAQFKIALCYLQLNKPEEAQAEFNRLIVAYPGSEFVSRALAQLEKLP